MQEKSKFKLRSFLTVQQYFLLTAVQQGEGMHGLRKQHSREPYSAVSVTLHSIKKSVLYYVYALSFERVGVTAPRRVHDI
jgi:hypothetical protein